MSYSAKDQWLREFFPEYSEKGKKLYHRKSVLTPKQRLISDFFERLKEEEILTSETNQTIMGMSDGFMISFLEEDGKWRGLAYKKERGNDVQIITPKAPTRQDADKMLHTFIKAYNK